MSALLTVDGVYVEITNSRDIISDEPKLADAIRSIDKVRDRFGYEPNPPLALADAVRALFGPGRCQILSVDLSLPYDPTVVY